MSKLEPESYEKSLFLEVRANVMSKVDIYNNTLKEESKESLSTPTFLVLWIIVTNLLGALTSYKEITMSVFAAFILVALGNSTLINNARSMAPKEEPSMMKDPKGRAKYMFWFAQDRKQISLSYLKNSNEVIMSDLCDKHSLGLDREQSVDELSEKLLKELLLHTKIESQ